MYMKPKAVCVCVCLSPFFVRQSRPNDAKYSKTYFKEFLYKCHEIKIGIVALALKAILRSKKAEKGQKKFET